MDEVLERAGTFADPVPAPVRARWDLADRTGAFTDIHAPEAVEPMLAARKRLVFDELLRIPALPWCCASGCSKPPPPASATGSTAHASGTAVPRRPSTWWLASTSGCRSR